MELAIDDAKARAQAMAGQASSPYGKDMSAEKGPLSFGQEVGNMGRQKLAKGLVDKGSEGIMSAFTPASAGAANTAALAANPATMGMAGPSLGAAGAGGAGMMATAGAAMPYVGAALLADKALGLGIMDSLFSEGGKVGPLSPQYKAEGGETMSQEEAMALMNNQPAPTPMPQPRPINFPDPEELLREMAMPTARPSPEEMYLYNNPNDVSMINEGYDPIQPAPTDLPQYRAGGGPLGMGILSMYQDMMKKNMR